METEHKNKINSINLYKIKLEQNFYGQKQARNRFVDDIITLTNKTTHRIRMKYLVDLKFNEEQKIINSLAP